LNAGLSNDPSRQPATGPTWSKAVNVGPRTCPTTTPRWIWTLPTNSWPTFLRLGIRKWRHIYFHLIFICFRDHYYIILSQLMQPSSIRYDTKLLCNLNSLDRYERNLLNMLFNLQLMELAHTNFLSFWHTLSTFCTLSCTL